MCFSGIHAHFSVALYTCEKLATRVFQQNHLPQRNFKLLKSLQSMGGEDSGKNGGINANVLVQNNGWGLERERENDFKAE